MRFLTNITGARSAAGRALHRPSAWHAFNWRRAGVAVAALALTASGACSSSPSSTDPYQGTWAGSMVDRLAGTGTVRVELRAGARLDGSWTAVVGGANLAGTLAADSSTGMQRNLAVSCGSQGSMVWAATVNGSNLSGSYITASCSGLSGGTFDLRRQ